MSSIFENEMNTIITTITLKELETALQDLFTKKILSPLEITNEMFKNTEPQAKKYLLSLMNKVLPIGTIPVEWITSYISLLPKSCNWEGSLNLIRPITLMETSRKLLTKILNSRIVAAIEKMNALLQFNFVELPGGRTLYLIKTLQNIIEDTQKYKKDLFLLFQDIK